MSEYRKIRATLLLAALLSLACATRSPGRQSFVSVQTPHFEIVSSFGEQRTLALARRLESFRAGVSRAIGAESVSRVGHAPRVRVLAFDDRSLTRPFARREEAVYFMPTVEAGLLVIRASGAWGRRGQSSPWNCTRFSSAEFSNLTGSEFTPRCRSGSAHRIGSRGFGTLLGALQLRPRPRCRQRNTRISSSIRGGSTISPTRESVEFSHSMPTSMIPSPVR